MFTTFAFYVLLWRLGIVALTTESVDQACCLAAQSVPPSDSRSPSVSIDPPITNKQQIHTLEIVAVNTLIENFQNKQMLNCQRFEGSEILGTMNPTPFSVLFSIYLMLCTAHHTHHMHAIPHIHNQGIMACQLSYHIVTGQKMREHDKKQLKQWRFCEKCIFLSISRRFSLIVGNPLLVGSITDKRCNILLFYKTHLLDMSLKIYPLNL